MAETTYAIVFNGEIVDGFQAISVKAHLTKMLKAPPEKMKVLFSGKPIVLKRTTDKAEAAKYGSALKKVGANVKVKIIKANANQPAPAVAATPATPAAPSTPSTPSTSATLSALEQRQSPPDTSNLSLAPNVGNIVDPRPEAPAPDIDLSSISLAENDGSLLVEPTPEVEVNIDVSSISIAENDGSPLVEPSVPTPKVDAPDFGLDAPGAMLETLNEEVEALNPDTSSMSLAFPGSELLNPEEKDQGPPPKAPDTSKLSVVAERASFDVG